MPKFCVTYDERTEDLLSISLKLHNLYMGLSVKIVLLKKQQVVTIREELLPSCGYL